MVSRRKRRGAAVTALAALAAVFAVAVAPTAGAAKPAPIYWKTFGQPVKIEPTRIEINYGTGVALATGLTEWDGWGEVSATAEGVLHLNTCRPDCAAGNYKAYRGRVTLFKVRHCNGQRRYMDIKIKPRNMPKATWGSDCRGAQIVAP